MIKTEIFKRLHNSEGKALSLCYRMFHERILKKLDSKLSEGKSGWDNPYMLDYLKESLIDHVAKGDMVDVAILAMFIWNIENE